MDKYLETLSKMKEFSQTFIPELNRIEAYIKGKINLQELIRNTDEIGRDIIYHAINRTIDYEEKAVRYYAKLLDRDMPCIIAGEVENVGAKYNRVRTIAPRVERNQFAYFRDDIYAQEVTGDFSSIPNGAMISYSDLLKIWSKYHNSDMKPKIIDKLRAFRDDLMGNWDGKEDIVPLKDIIDSIQFVKPNYYFTLEDLKSGDFGTFEDLLNRKAERIYRGK